MAFLFFPPFAETSCFGFIPPGAFEQCTYRLRFFRGQRAQRDSQLLAELVHEKVQQAAVVISYVIDGFIDLVSKVYTACVFRVFFVFSPDIIDNSF